MEYRKDGPIEHWVSTRGELTMWPHRASVFHYRVDRYFSFDLVEVVFERYDRFTLQFPAPFVIFADFETITNYDSQVRIKATDWFKPRLANLNGFHVLVGSKLVSMGLATISLLSGLKITSYSRRAEFERVLAEAEGRDGDARVMTAKP